MDRLIELLSTKKIDKMHYDTYMQFGISESGSTYLNNLLLMVCMEEPPKNVNAGFAWKDGRISIVRQIKQQIELVDNLLNGVIQDDSHSGDTSGAIPIPTADFRDSIPGAF